MNNHLRRLGLLYLVYGFVCSVVTFFFIKTAVGQGPILGVASILNSIPGFRSVLAFLFAITAVPALLAGFGLLWGKTWARVLAQVLGFLSLVNIPLGTMVGIYTIWVFMKDEGDLQANSDNS